MDYKMKEKMEMINGIQKNVECRLKEYSTHEKYLYDQYLASYNKFSIEECKEFIRNDNELYLWTHKSLCDFLNDEGIFICPDVLDMYQTVNLFRYYTAKSIIKDL